jgi:hypothetical protein
MPLGFIRAQRDQRFLPPGCMHEWLPEDDLAYLAVEVVEALDLAAFRGLLRPALPPRSWVHGRHRRRRGGGPRVRSR